MAQAGFWPYMNDLGQKTLRLIESLLEGCIHQTHFLPSISIATHCTRLAHALDRCVGPVSSAYRSQPFPYSSGLDSTLFPTDPAYSVFELSNNKGITELLLCARSLNKCSVQLTSLYLHKDPKEHVHYHAHFTQEEKQDLQSPTSFAFTHTVRRAEILTYII